MGCEELREKIEDEMIAIKLERVGIQIERKKQIKLLEEIDGRRIKEPKIPDYIILNLNDKNKITKRVKKTQDNI